MKLFFKHKIILENYRTPVIPIDEIDQMLMSIPENVSKELSIPKDVLNSFELRDELNPNLWDNFSLKPSIRIRLLKVANDFFKELKLPPNVGLKDVLFTGSLANFNWSKFSDIDLHLVLDFSQVEAPQQMKDDFFYLQKTQWNENHDIKLFGYPIEIYTQDLSQKLTATAIYSVKRDKWILKPKREEFKLSKKNIKAKAESFIRNLQDIKDDYNNQKYQSAIDKADSLKDKIKNYRLSGLDKGGEFSLENLVFKVLRRTPFMDILSDIKANAYDKLLSLNEKTL
jgi:predicted nucleotidyltransferase